jgi:four helix bundle protein
MPRRVTLDHERLDVYQVALEFLAWATDLIEQCKGSAGVRVGPVCDHLDRASLSILLNIAEGNGKRQMRTRAKFFDDARGSATECAACLDALVAKRVCPSDRMAAGKGLLVRIVGMLSRLVDKFDVPSEVREDAAEYCTGLDSMPLRTQAAPGGRSSSSYSYPNPEKHEKHESQGRRESTTRTRDENEDGECRGRPQAAPGGRSSSSYSYSNPEKPEKPESQETRKSTTRTRDENGHEEGPPRTQAAPGGRSSSSYSYSNPEKPEKPESQETRKSATRTTKNDDEYEGKEPAATGRQAGGPP